MSENKLNKVLDAEKAVTLTPFKGLKMVLKNEDPGSQMLEELFNADLINSKNVESSLNYSLLEDKWFNIWSEEIEGEIRVPENFSDFLQEYIKSYLISEEESTLYRMLKTDFMYGLILKEEKTGLPSTLRELKNQMKKSYGRNHYVSFHVKSGLDNSN